MERRHTVWPDPWMASWKKLVKASGFLYPIMFGLAAATTLIGTQLALDFLSLGLFLVTLSSVWFTCYLLLGRGRGWVDGARCVQFPSGNATIVGEESVAGRLSILLPQIVAVPFLVAFPWVAGNLPESQGYGVERMTSRLIILSVPLLLLGLWLLVRMVRGLSGIRRRLIIALTGEGVLYRDAVGSYFVSWRELGSVVPGEIGQVIPSELTRTEDPETGERSLLERFTKMPRYVHGGRLTVNPVVPYVAICFYLRHEELRHELSTPAAAERITPEGMDEVLREIEAHGVVRPEYFRPGSSPQ